MKKYLTVILIVLCVVLPSCYRKEKSETYGTTTPAATSESVSAERQDTQPASSSKSAAPTVRQTAAPTVVKTTPRPATTTTARQQVSVLIQEGFSVSQIGDRLEKYGVCNKSDFLKQINEYPFELSRYSLVKKIPLTQNRCYRLEGYLYPDTYNFYCNMKPEDAIGIMLRGAEAKIGTNGANYTYPDRSTDQIITLASIIEREAAKTEDMARVSSVFHNRLKAGWKLQADSTIDYIMNFVKPNLTGDVDRYNGYYNTYKCNSLPEGPICSPGANALYAATHPAATDYMYFVSDKSGYIHYAKTQAKQDENIIKAGYTPSANP